MEETEKQKDTGLQKWRKRVIKMHCISKYGQKGVKRKEEGKREGRRTERGNEMKGRN